jgi:hypothetical protein
VPLDHGGEVLVRGEALPLQLRAPVVEELPRPGLTVVVPQLTEGLFGLANCSSSTTGSLASSFMVGSAVVRQSYAVGCAADPHPGRIRS